TTAIYRLRTLVVTKSIEVNFLKPVLVGLEMKVEGRLLGSDGSREVSTEGFLTDPKGVLCAKASGVFAILNPEAASRFGLDGSLQDDLEKFISS
ncbi:MAG: hypothetical protein LLG06_11310, partial [Desulfobacteraceae bacterium]|nr:hypothetical protein [Desulfobacteraceae bacterium]